VKGSENMILKFLVGLGVMIAMILIAFAVLFLFGLLVYGVDEIKETKIGKLIKFIGKVIGKILSFLLVSIFVIYLIAMIYQLGDAI